MRCREFDALLCDHLDGTAPLEDRRRVDDHVAECAACAAKLSDAEFTLQVIQETPRIEPPSELVRSIIHETVEAAGGMPVLAGAGSGSWGLGGFLRPFLHPLLQPRLAMSFAMAVFSFSIVTFYGKGAIEGQGNSRVAPAMIAAGISDGLDQAWATGVELYETTVLFYRLQTEFGEGEIQIVNPATVGERDQSEGGAGASRGPPRERRQ